MLKGTSRVFAGIAVFAAVALGTGAETGDSKRPDTAADRARETIRAWMETEDAISREKADWEAEKATMGELLALHRKELARLDEELSKAGMSAPGHEERMKKARAEWERLEAARSKLAKVLASEVPRMLRLSKRFPEPLRRKAREDLAALEAWKPGGEVRDALRALLGAASKAEAFNRRVTRVREVRGGREVEVLYLGLARAYYVGGDAAGVGEPGPDGWTWREEPDLAAPLKRALAVLDKKRPPEVVTLPVKVLHPTGKEGGK